MSEYLLKNGFVDNPQYSWEETIHADSYEDACRKAKIFTEAKYSCCVNSKRIKGITVSDLYDKLKSQYETSKKPIVGSLVWCFDDDYSHEENLLWEKAWERYHEMVADLVWWEIVEINKDVKSY